MVTQEKFGMRGWHVVAHLLVVSGVAVIIACAGCDANNLSSPNPQNQSSSRIQDLILGNWTWTGNFQGKVITITNDFRKNGVVKVVQDGTPIDANYKVVGEDQIDYGMYGRSKIVSITKDKLDIIGTDGERRTWTRP